MPPDVLLYQLCPLASSRDSRKDACPIYLIKGVVRACHFLRKGLDLFLSVSRLQDLNAVYD